MPNPSLVTVLARAFLAGAPTVEQVVARASRTLGRPWRWLRPVAQRYINAYAGRTRPRRRDVVQFLRHDPGFEGASSKYLHELSVERWVTEPQQMQPVRAAETWAVPAIESAGALADWLLLNPGELDWFADLKGLGYGRKDRPRLRHYHYRSPRGPKGCLADGLAGFLSLDLRSEDSNSFSHDGLSRIGCRSARWNLHECRSTGSVERPCHWRRYLSNAGSAGFV
jgi:hypothetical protein